MKALGTLTVGITCISAILLSRAPSAEESSEAPAAFKVHWYYVDQDQGVDLAGASDLLPDQLAGEISAGRYVRLSNYRIRDANGVWSSSASERARGTIYVRPELIRNFVELTDDPLKFQNAGQTDR